MSTEYWTFWGNFGQTILEQYHQQNSTATFRVVVTFSHPQECRNFPPGFRRYPLIGNLPSMSFMSRIMFDAAEAAKTNSKFSPFMGYFLGPSERLLLNLLRKDAKFILI